MSVKKKTVKSVLEKYYSDNIFLNNKLDNLSKSLSENDSIFKWRHFEQYLNTFIQGEKDIPDFYEQFKKLINFYNENPKLKSSNNLEICKLKYGESLGIKKYEEIQNKNPFKNHNGRLSPFHKGSVNYNKEALNKAIQNRSYNSRLDFWINKGYSINEAKEALSERQRTFTKEKCIEKYGIEKGTEIWKNRQEKWQNTLNSKSEEEKQIISFLKSSGTGNIDKEKHCTLYYIHFYNKKINFWKIGITTRKLEDRLRLKKLCQNNNLNYDILFEKDYKNCLVAHFYEHKYLREFLDCRVKIDIFGFKSGECFNKDIFEGNYDF